MSLSRALTQMASGNRVQSLLARALSASERRVARQIFWMGAALAVQVVSGLATVALTARILGVEGVGILAAITAFTRLIYGFAALPGDVVITTFVTRAVAEGRPEEGASVFRFSLAASLGLALIAYGVIAVLAFTAGHLLNIGQDTKDIIFLFGVCGVLTAMNGTSLAVLRLADRMQVYLLLTVASTVTGAGLLMAVWLTGGGLTEVVLTHIAVAAVSGLGLFTSAALCAPLAGLGGFLRSATLKIPPHVIRFHAAVYWRGIVATLVDNMDVILLAQFTGTANVGLYRTARRIVDMARLPIALISNVAQPEYSRQWYSGQGTELRRTALRLTILSIALAAAGFSVLAVFREPIIRFFLGDAFSGAAPLLLIMLLGALPFAAAFRLLPRAVGRVWPPVLTGMAELVVFLVAMAWLAPEYGAAGAAWARTLSGLTAFLVIIPFAALVLRQSYRLCSPGEAE